MTLKKLIIPIFAAIVCRLFTGCISFQKYPSTWPEKKEVNTASQLSGTYDPGLLRILNGFMQLPYVQDTGAIKVQLLVNDSLQYEVNALQPTSETTKTGTLGILQLSKITSPGSTRVDGFFVKKKFNEKKGLRISYNPGQKVRQGATIDFVSRDYLLMNKDKEGNLVIKHGEQWYGLFFIFFPFIVDQHEWISVRGDSVLYTKHRMKSYRD